MQFVFFACILAWHLAHADCKHSQARAIDSSFDILYCQRQNALLELFITRRYENVYPLNHVSWPLFFHQFSFEYCKRNAKQTFLISIHFQQLIRTRRKSNSSNNLPAIAFFTRRNLHSVSVCNKNGEEKKKSEFFRLEKKWWENNLSYFKFGFEKL